MNSHHDTPVEYRLAYRFYLNYDMLQESEIELRTRAETFWSEFISQAKADIRVAIVSHGHLINMLFQSFLDLPMDSKIGIGNSDTGVHLWKLDKGARSIMFLNKCDHLKKG